MARVSTYLNFMGRTEEAFGFYRDVFGTEFDSEPMRMGDIPSGPGMPELSAGGTDINPMTDMSCGAASSAG